MRTLLFRTEPVALDSSVAQVVFAKDFDGATPVTITVENEDLKAKVVTSDRYGSPHSKLEFEWATAGTSGNAKSVIIEEDEDDPTGIAVNAVSDVLTYTIGAAVLAWQVVAMLDGDAGMTVRLAQGSDGSAPVIPPRLEDDESGPREYDLDGGAAATTTGAATVEVAPTMDGPWVADSAAGTALGTVAEGSPKSHTYTVPVRCVRLSMVKNSADTHVVASARKALLV